MGGWYLMGSTGDRDRISLEDIVSHLKWRLDPKPPAVREPVRAATCMYKTMLSIYKQQILM